MSGTSPTIHPRTGRSHEGRNTSTGQNQSWTDSVASTSRWSPSLISYTPVGRGEEFRWRRKVAPFQKIHDPVHTFENRTTRRAGILSFNNDAGFEDQMPSISQWFAK